MNSHNFTGGRNNRIADLVADRSHLVEAWGNSREGFEPYLRMKDSNAACSIGPRFRTLSGLRLAVQQAYSLNGRAVRVPIGRAW